MPKINIDYLKIVIYKIVCNTLSISDCYVGSTTDFTRRKYAHKYCCNNENYKTYNLKIYEIIRKNGGWENWTMVKIEDYPCQDGNEARKRERFYYEELHSNMNINCPWRDVKDTDKIKEYAKEYNKEYYELNIDKFKANAKEYYELNTDKIKANIKEYQGLNTDKIKEYRELNADEIKANRKEYYKLNTDKSKANCKKYRELNADAIKENCKKYRELNADKIKSNRALNADKNIKYQKEYRNRNK
jgi:hypothetical protein